MGKRRPAEQPPDARYQQLIVIGQQRLEAAEAPPGQWDLLVLELQARHAAGDPIGHRQFSKEHGLTHTQYLEFAACMRRPKKVPYYARPEVRRSLCLWAAHRTIVADYEQGPLGVGFRHPEDITLLAAADTRAAPSFHASVGRYQEDQLTGFDLVAEVDYKGDWRTCFAVTLPLVERLHHLGFTFLVKFSGHSSAHVVVPCRGAQFAAANTLFRMLVEHVLPRSERLDRTFLRPQRLLRLPYSLHERTGLVSLPLTISQYEHFDPEMARPENVVVAQERLVPVLESRSSNGGGDWAGDVWCRRLGGRVPMSPRSEPCDRRSGSPQ